MYHRIVDKSSPWLRCGEPTTVTQQRDHMRRRGCGSTIPPTPLSTPPTSPLSSVTSIRRISNHRVVQKAESPPPWLRCGEPTTVTWQQDHMRQWGCCSIVQPMPLSTLPIVPSLIATLFASREAQQFSSVTSTEGSRSDFHVDVFNPPCHGRGSISSSLSPAWLLPAEESSSRSNSLSPS